jgi:hypothetical protein
MVMIVPGVQLVFNRTVTGLFYFHHLLLLAFGTASCVFWRAMMGGTQGFATIVTSSTKHRYSTLLTTCHSEQPFSICGISNRFLWALKEMPQLLFEI